MVYFCTLHPLIGTVESSFFPLSTVHHGTIALFDTVEATCLPLSDVAHGNIEYQNVIQSGQYDLGTPATITCDSGYRPFGPNSVTCLQSGEWSGTFQCRGDKFNT